MKRSILILFFSAAAFAARTFNFDSLPPGPLVLDWVCKPRWVIRKDDSAPSRPNVLAQIATSGFNRFPLAIFNAASFRDGELSVMFKTIWGKRAQAAGLVWRYQDENNYYLVRANAVDNDIELFKVEGGKRIPIAPFSVRHPIPARTWEILKVTFRGPRFDVYFDHRRVFQAVDNSFMEPGRVGLWALADSVTYFDDFRVSQK